MDSELAHSDRVPAPLEEGPAEQDELFTALQQLPEMQRKVVVLRHWLGLNVNETAVELQISAGTVKSHSSRGLEALRRVLGDAAAGEAPQTVG